MKGKKNKIPNKDFEFRVIAGSLKGRKITAPNLGVTRPPLTRLRKSIFDYLRPRLLDARYLDLFSGTGSYLFEAVSRGVAVAHGVELNDRLAGHVNSQATRLGVEERLFCHCEDVFDAVPRLAAQGQPYDIVMIAPPQYQYLIDKTLVAMREHRLVTPESLILCQHDTSEKKTDFLDFKIEQHRKYGNTTYTIVKQTV